MEIELPDVSDWNGMTRDQARSLVVNRHRARILAAMDLTEVESLVPAWKKLLNGMRQKSRGYEPLAEWERILSNNGNYSPVSPD